MEALVPIPNNADTASFGELPRINGAWRIADVALKGGFITWLVDKSEHLTPDQSWGLSSPTLPPSDQIVREQREEQQRDPGVRDTVMALDKRGLVLSVRPETS